MVAIPAKAQGRCTSCRAPIIWARTNTGRLMPLDPIPSANQGNVTLTYNVGTHELNATVHGKGVRELGFDEYWLPHFATCPHADRHRSERGEGRRRGA